MVIKSTPLKAPKYMPKKADVPPEDGNFTFGGRSEYAWGSGLFWLLSFLGFAGLTVWIAMATLDRTGSEGSSGSSSSSLKLLRSANLAGAQLTQVPVGWQDRDIAMRQYFASYCRRPETYCGEDVDAARGFLLSDDFQAEFLEHRRALIAQMKKPSFADKDLRGADLRSVNATGMSFRDADLSGADLSDAVLESADLTDVQIAGVSFDRADVRNAIIKSADAEAYSSGFRSIQAYGATLQLGTLRNVDFRGALLTDARLGGTITGHFEDDFDAPMSFRRADLTNTRIENSYVSAGSDPAVFAGANLLGFEESHDGNTHLPNGRTARLSGTALHFVDLSRVATPWAADLADFHTERWVPVFRNSFGDATVRLPPGALRPCHWPRARLGLIEFHGAWRAWLEAGGQSYPPVDTLRAITLIGQNAAGDTVEKLASEVSSRPDLLPPADICNWDSCDCEKVDEWRAEQN
ncbi:MAG: pentapeptide repeat-containing protein [Paracoccaceae bacterium]|nr:pentapeptide repeat-containing protein [Paracoccaceae bacterium]